MTAIAIAGLGAASRTIHLPAYAGLPTVKVVGGFDPLAKAGDFRFPLFATAQKMLEQTRPDILTVVTPPDSHFALTKLGLDAGCHVFCEKPFMTTMAEAQEVVTISRRVRRWVVVNNQYRFMNIHDAAQRRIGSREFGDLVFLAANQAFRSSAETEAGWRGQDPRRTCKEFGTHVLDLCRFFFGEDPRAVTARMPRPGRPGGPDLLNLIELEFSGDRVAHITLDRLWRGPTRYLSLRLDGTAAGIETHIGGVLEMRAGIRSGSRWPFVKLDVAMGGRADLYAGDRPRRIASDPLNLFSHATRRLLAAVLNAIASGEKPPCNAEDNLRTLALMFAAYESAEQGKTIQMDYDSPAVP